jgi:hypothetical protein
MTATEPSRCSIDDFLCFFASRAVTRLSAGHIFLADLILERANCAASINAMRTTTAPSLASPKVPELSYST